MIEHGNYSIELEGNLLSIILVGSFNDIATHAICQKVQANIESLNEQAFALLLICTDYEGSTPDAHKISNQYLTKLNKQNCIARAAVYRKTIYADMAKNEQPAMFGFQNRREFFDEASAKTWLLSQLGSQC